MALHVKFFADAMLGSLSRWLRTLGCDVEYEREIDDKALLDRAIREDRVILTKDTLLAKRRLARGRAFLVKGVTLDAQLREVVGEFGIGLDAFLTRCVRCNTQLLGIDKKDVEARVPEYVFKTQGSFSRCPSCARIYWGGTHAQEMKKAIGGFLKGAVVQDTRYVIAYVSAPNAEEAGRIGKAIVEEGLSACCNVIPSIRSIYKWKGSVCDEPEALCVFKTKKALFPKFKDRVKALHSYEVPEIICVDIADGLPEYLSWIDDTCVKAD